MKTRAYIGAEQEFWANLTRREPRPKGPLTRLKEVVFGEGPQDIVEVTHSSVKSSQAFEQELPGGVSGHKNKLHAKWTRGGGVFYDDGDAVQEFVTGLVELEKGAPTRLAEAMLLQRALALKPSEASVEAGSQFLVNTHYNVGVRPEHSESVAWLSARSVAAAHTLLLPGEQPWYRHPEGRLELCTLNTGDREQLVAGITLLAGTSRGLDRMLAERGGDREAVLSDLPLRLTEVEVSKPKYKSGFAIDYPKEIIRKGSRARLATDQGWKTAGELLQVYVDFFSEDIKAIATDEEWKTLQDFVEGQDFSNSFGSYDGAYLVAQTGQTVSEFIDGYQTEGVAALFEVATLRPEASFKDDQLRIERKTTGLEWKGMHLKLSAWPSQTTTVEAPARSETLFVETHRMAEYAQLEEKLGGTPSRLFEVATRLFGESANPVGRRIRPVAVDSSGPGSDDRCERPGPPSVARRVR